MTQLDSVMKAWVLKGMWRGLCQMSLQPSSLVVMHCWGWGVTFHAFGVQAFVAPGHLDPLAWLRVW